MIVRAARAGEGRVLTSLAREAKASWGYPESWMRRWRSELTISDEYIQQHRVLVAEDESGVIGMVALELRCAEPELAHLWIRPAKQREGVGSALVRAALSHVAPLGLRALRVVSDPNAVAFYTRLGARRTGWIDASFADVDRRLPVLSLPVVAGAAEDVGVGV